MEEDSRGTDLSNVIRIDDERAQDDASDAILLERKDNMRKRGLASPDDGNALALTCAYPEARRDWAEEHRFEEKLEKLRRRIV